MQLGIYHRSHRQNTLADNQSNALQSLPTSRHKLLLLNRHKNVPEAITRILAYPNTRSVRRTLPGAMAKTIFTAAPLQEPSQGLSIIPTSEQEPSQQPSQTHPIHLRNPHASHLKNHLRFLHPTHRKNFHRSLAKSYIRSIAWTVSRTITRTLADSQIKSVSKEPPQEPSQIYAVNPNKLLQESSQIPTSDPSQELLQKSLQGTVTISVARTDANS